MPLVRIDVNKNASTPLIKAISDAVYRAMVEIANVPLHDNFQIVTRHAREELIYPEAGYLGMAYSPDIIFIQITWVAGRTTDVKKRFYHQIAQDIVTNGGARPEDVFISLIESNREDWSFGNGQMQYAPNLDH